MKQMVFTYDNVSVYSMVSNWSFEDIWMELENDEQYELNPRCIFHSMDLADIRRSTRQSICVPHGFPRKKHTDSCCQTGTV